MLNKSKQYAECNNCNEYMIVKDSIRTKTIELINDKITEIFLHCEKCKTDFKGTFENETTKGLKEKLKIQRKMNHKNKNKSKIEKTLKQLETEIRRIEKIVIEIRKENKCEYFKVEIKEIN